MRGGTYRDLRQFCQLRDGIDVDWNVAERRGEHCRRGQCQERADQPDAKNSFPVKGQGLVGEQSPRAV